MSFQKCLVVDNIMMFTRLYILNLLHFILFCYNYISLSCYTSVELCFQNLHGYGFNDNMQGVPPYFVRRWAPKVKASLRQSFFISSHVIPELILCTIRLISLIFCSYECKTIISCFSFLFGISFGRLLKYFAY